MSTEAFTGELMPFVGNFVVREYLACDGQLVSIGQYTSLYSIMSTFYGGDGRVSFAMPDLRGRSLIGHGKAPDLMYDYQIGMFGGIEEKTLTEYHLPTHNHTASAQVPPITSATESSMLVANNNANTPAPNISAFLGKPQDQNFFVSNPFESAQPVGIKGINVDVQSSASTNVGLNNTGRSESIDIRNPVQAVNWLICADNLYPQRP
ncbi:phage tail protein [Pseudoalteromonas rubra]|uniref:Phage tail protein n=1 Tax=Pseudoalteromonas rubra TaxID=43658 RepID=A0A5S3WQ63_9GAMM|nr:tail fiber protein [Pseudoalteromonas rubra]TMP29538.1 phage tail protein [Pseudoalteromonas rubra]TMP35132.1 phage tail protein [Pseudoalteromonas rubra]